MRSVGHTGTLDPFATGLLILLTGRATRLARFVEQQRKTYLATVRLGFRTTTDDRTGAVIGPERSANAIPREAVEAALAAMRGVQWQTPPAYSAKKVGGERSYRLARKGAEVALAPVEISVDAIDLVSYAPPLVTFRATVSAGTYLRVMARDLGERLDVGGHLESLRREAIGTIRVEDAVTLAEVERTPRLQPLGLVLAHLDRVDLTDAEHDDVSHGRPVRRTDGGTEHLQLVWEDRVVAVARQDGEWLRPVVVLEGT